MSYFNPAFKRLGKVSSDTNFQGCKNKAFKFSRDVFSRLAPPLEVAPRGLSFDPATRKLLESVRGVDCGVA